LGTFLVDDPIYGPRHLFGVPTAVDVPIDPLYDLAVPVLVWGAIQYRGMVPSRCDIGGKIPWGQVAYLDAKILGLHPKGLGDQPQSPLAGRIEAPEGQSHMARNGSDVHDGTPALCPHLGQHGLDHMDRAIEIGVEHLQDLL